MKLKLFLSLIPLALFAELQAPSQLSLQALSSHSVLIAWVDNSDNETGFKIFRGNNLIHTTSINAQNFVDTNLKAHTTYTYTVMATDDDAEDKSQTIHLTQQYEIPEDALFLDIRNDWERAHYGGYPAGSVVATYELREEPDAGESEDRSKRHINENFIQEVLNLTHNNKHHHLVIICATGGRTGAYGNINAPSTAKLLKEYGFSYVEDIFGGIWDQNGWQDNHLPWVQE